jgi:hypothetical protein
MKHPSPSHTGTALHVLERELERAADLDGAVVAYVGPSSEESAPHGRHILTLLVERGAIVRIFDPYFPKRSSARTLESALAGADVALIATNHEVVRRALTPTLLQRSGVGTLIDLARYFLPRPI